MDNQFLQNYKQKGAEKQEEQELQFEQTSDFQPVDLPPAPTQNRKFPIVYVTVGVCVAVVLAVLLLIFGRGTALPDMVGWTQSQAQLWASENDVLVRVVDEYSDSITLGEVMTQDPVEGERVKSGNFIELTVSAGADLSVLVAVPDLMSMTKTEVESWSAENLMSKVRITTEESKTVESGTAISYTINDNSVIGDEVRRDTPIYVVYSTGVGEGDPITLPDFTMMTLDEATAFAEEQQLILTVEEVFDDNLPAEQIIKQSVDAEEVVTAGDEIILTVSLGKEIRVLDFSQYSMDVAQIKASQAGIMTLVEERYSSSSAGVLLSQSISSGTLYDEDDIVTLTYSLGNSFVLESFVGASQEALNAWITPLNEQGASLKISATTTASDQPIGTILSQSDENSVIGISKTINIVVSSGHVIYVPDFVQSAGSSYADIITRESVIEQCQALSLIPVFIAESKEGRLQGEVWSQSLTAGKEVQQGSTIEIKYVPVIDTYKVPDFTGLTQADIVANGYDKQFAISYEDDGTGNAVVSQSVKSGSSVAIGSAVTVYLY